MPRMKYKPSQNRVSYSPSLTDALCTVTTELTIVEAHFKGSLPLSHLINNQMMVSSDHYLKRIFLVYILPTLCSIQHTDRILNWPNKTIIPTRAVVNYGLIHFDNQRTEHICTYFIILLSLSVICLACNCSVYCHLILTDTNVPTSSSVSKVVSGDMLNLQLFYPMFNLTILLPSRARILKRTFLI